MKKVLLLLFPTFSEFEVTVATAVLRHTHSLVTIAWQNIIVTGESGLQIVPHATVDLINPAEYEALIIPGGNTVHMVDAEPVFSLIRQMNDQGAWLAAIGSGPYMLARAGLLDNRPYTVTLTRAQRDFLSYFNEATFVYEPVVEMGNVITAQGHAFVEFGLRLGERLGTVTDTAAWDFYTGRANVNMVAE